MTGGRVLAASGAVVCAAGFGLSTAYALAHRADPGAADLAVHRWAVTHRGGGLTTAAIAVTVTGSGPLAYLLAVLAGVLAVGRAGSAARSVAVRRAARGALVAVAVLALVELVRSALSVLVDRQRPPTADWAWSAGGLSFPSGHTATSAVVGLLLCLAIGRRGSSHAVRRAVRTAAVLWAVLVGTSRVVLGVHWPTDVLGSWLLVGALALVLAAAAPRSAVGRLLGEEQPTGRA